MRLDTKRTTPAVISAPCWETAGPVYRFTCAQLCVRRVWLEGCGAEVRKERPARLDRDGLELGDDVAEDGELEAEEDEDADPVGDRGVAGDGESVEGELGDGEVGARLGEGMQAGAEQEEEGVYGNTCGDPSGGGGESGRHWLASWARIAEQS